MNCWPFLHSFTLLDIKGRKYIINRGWTVLPLYFWYKTVHMVCVMKKMLQWEATFTCRESDSSAEPVSRRPCATNYKACAHDQTQWWIQDLWKGGGTSWRAKHTAKFFVRRRLFYSYSPLKPTTSHYLTIRHTSSLVPSRQSIREWPVLQCLLHGHIGGRDLSSAQPQSKVLEGVHGPTRYSVWSLSV